MITIEFLGCEDKEFFERLSNIIKKMYVLMPPYVGDIEIRNIKGFAVEFNRNRKEIEIGDKISVMVTSNNRIEAEKIGLILEMLGFG